MESQLSYMPNLNFKYCCLYFEQKVMSLSVVNPSLCHLSSFYLALCHLAEFYPQAASDCPWDSTDAGLPVKLENCFQGS